MFIDTAKIKLKAGDGGNGCVSFHREKYVANGGPDGGDGGRGGSIIFAGDTNLSTLADFRYKKEYTAPNGENGRGKRCNGRGGADVIIKVPVGTIIKSADTGRIIADIHNTVPVTVVKGGGGGAGNMHFATPARQTPRFAKPGIPGEAIEVLLELKLLADVGLVGFPNAGKSTLISALSNARPLIADYPFSTLNPILGIVNMGIGSSFVMADMPGIIEKASEGVGLGHRFLRHIERCRMLVILVDAASVDGRDPVSDLDVVLGELSKYSEQLSGLPKVVCANKCDCAIPEMLEALNTHAKSSALQLFEISAVTGKGLEGLKNHIWSMLKTLPAIKTFEPEREEIIIPPQKNDFTIENKEGVFIIEAQWLIRLLGSVNMDDYESLQYFQRVLRKSGIIDELERMGVNEGDTVSIYDFEFEYVR